MHPQLTKLVEILRLYDPEKIYLFGSWGRGEADELSDIDVVIIKRTDVPFLERLRQVAELLPADMGAVDLLVYTPEEFAVMQEDGNAFACMVADEAQVIYDRAA